MSDGAEVLYEGEILIVELPEDDPGLLGSTHPKVRKFLEKTPDELLQVTRRRSCVYEVKRLEDRTV